MSYPGQFMLPRLRRREAFAVQMTVSGPYLRWYFCECRTLPTLPNSSVQAWSSNGMDWYRC
jgi:hypothetical protein